jgi:hypothetical protein
MQQMYFEEFHGESLDGWESVGSDYKIELNLSPEFFNFGASNLARSYPAFGATNLPRSTRKFGRASCNPFYFCAGGFKSCMF